MVLKTEDFFAHTSFDFVQPFPPEELSNQIALNLEIEHYLSKNKKIPSKVVVDLQIIMTLETGNNTGGLGSC